MPGTNGPGHLNPLENEILKIIEEYHDINRLNNRIKAEEYNNLVARLHQHDITPFKLLIEKAGADGDPGLKRMLGGLLSIIITLALWPGSWYPEPGFPGFLPRKVLLPVPWR